MTTVNIPARNWTVGKHVSAVVTPPPGVQSVNLSIDASSFTDPGSRLRIGIELSRDGGNTWDIVVDSLNRGGDAIADAAGLIEVGAAWSGAPTDANSRMRIGALVSGSTVPLGSGTLVVA